MDLPGWLPPGGGQPVSKAEPRTLHSPYFSRLRHTGMASRLNSCKKPHSSPFMHKFFSQYVQTVCSSKAG
jgi:hypothetical protein